ncbi:mucin-binding protein [Lactobacillus gasseri]|uniref:mucin-binding protein n=1 Tax=Lactobacillus gasseri TaxID=1596 RepID=UPI003B9F85DD
MSSNMFGDKHNHYSIRKLSVGAASVLIGATIYLGGVNAQAVRADSVNEDATEQVEKKDEANVKAAEVKTTEQKQENNKTAVSATNENAKQNVAENTSDSKKVASNRDVNVIKNDVTTDEKAAAKSSVQTDKDVNANKLNTNTVSVNKLQRNVNVAGLAESKATSEINSTLSVRESMQQKAVSLKANEIARTVIMNKPAGPDQITQSVKLGTMLGSSNGQIIDGKTTKIYTATVIAVGSSTDMKKYRVTVDSDTGEILAGQDLYDTFMNLQPSDFKVNLDAIDQSQIDVPGYTWKITSATPAGANIGKEDYTFGNPQTITIDYTRDVEGNIKKKVTEITDKLVNNQMTTEPARTVILKKTTTGAANDETIVQKADIRGFARTSSKTVAGITEKKIEVAIAPYVEPDKLSSKYRKKFSITFNPDTGQIISGQNDYDQLMALKRSDFKADLPAIEDSQIDVPGYTAIITPPGANLGDETYTFGHPQTITIDYTKEHTVTYQFKDPSGHQVGTSVPVTGAVGSNQSVNLTLPDGYQLASGSLPTSVTIPESDRIISIPVKYQLTITLSGESVFNYADYNWQNLVKTNELPASGYNVSFNDAHARVQLNDGDVTYNENRNVGTYDVSLTKQGLQNIKDQLGDNNFIYPDLKDVTSTAKFKIDKGNKTIFLTGGDTKVFDNTSTLPDQGTFYSGLGLGDDNQGRISVYNSDGNLKAIQLKPKDVEFWLNGHKIDKDQAKNVGNYNLRLTDDFINEVKAADGNNGNNYEWSYGTHTPSGSDTYAADYVIYQATGKANLSGNNSKLYDGNAVTTNDVNKGRKITIDLTLPVYKQADEPGDEPQLLGTVDLGKYTLQDGDYTWANGTAPTKGGSYTINLNKDKILDHLKARLVDLAGMGTDPDDSTKPLSNVTITTDDMDGQATFAIETTTAYQFVDDDDNGSKVGTPVSKTGLKGESSNISLAVPTNYVLAAGQTLPTSVTFGDTNTTVDIHLKHATKTVDKNNVPDGYTKDDFAKTINRTITAKEPTGDVDLSQTTELTRTGTYDEVTKKVISYGNWTTGNFDEVTAPEVAGYTPSQASVAAVTGVTTDYVDPKVVITYAPNDQTGKISYVDVNTGTEVGNTPLTGKTDEEVTINPVAPTGWKIVDGQSIPRTEKATPTGIPPVTVKVEHKTTVVPPTDPKTPKDKLPDNPDKHYPDGVGEKDLNKIIVRQITVVKPDGTREKHDQSVKLTRNATVDEVTGEVIKYGDWTTSNFGEYDAPTVPGYTPSQAKVEGVKVTADSDFAPVTITYTANPHTLNINYVDKDGNKIGNSYQVPGRTDETVAVDVPGHVPANWELVPNQKYTTSITFGSDDPQDQNYVIQHKTTTTDGRDHKDNQDLYREVTRTILMKVPNATSQGRETETLSFYRIKTHDEVTGKDTYSDWASNVTGDKIAFDEFDVSKTNDGKEIAAGYTPTSNDVVLEDKNGDKFVPSQSALKNGVPADSFTVEVAYTPNAQKTTVTYVDENGKEITNPDGSVIPGSHYDLTGVTDQSNVPTNIQNNVPTNWHITDPEVPATITFGADGHTPIKVHVAHNTKPVDKNDVPDGYKESDFSKTINRTITANEPSKSVDLSQKTELTRTGTYDVVTKKVISYGNWTTGKFDEVKAPEVAGYTPNPASVNAESVTADYVDPKLVINYTPNDQTGKISYVDVNTGTEVGITPLTGKTDSDVTITPSAPAGWKIVDGQNIPTTEKATPTGIATVTVKVEHKTTTVPPTDPKTPKDKLPDNPDKHYPDGVSEKDLNKTFVRQITVVKPDGTKESHDQSIKLTRTATVDEVTGEVTKYSDWTTGNFGEYDAPVIPGYTPSQAKVEGVKVTADSDFTPVEITYAPNAQKTTVTYVDENGKEITNPDGSVIPGSHYDVTGVTNKKVDTNIQKNVPTNWHITDPEVPATITFGADGHTPITVHVAHNTKTVDKNDVPDNYKESDFSKTIKRTITAKEPNKDVDLSQEIELTRTGTYDEVTKKVISYSDWTTGKFDEVKAPEVAGYTPSQAKVDGVDKVTVDYVDPNVVITYIEDPVGQDITVKKGDTPDPEDGVKNHGDLDKITDPKHPGTKTTYTWKKTPDTSVPGDVPATVIVHYPDGSDKPVDITVHVVDDTPVVPTKNPDPVGQDITVKKGDTPDPEDGVKNHGDLDKITDPKHPGTKTTYTWKKTPDTSVAGDVPATVVVHYPDGSDKPVDITVHVVDDTPVVPTKNPDPVDQDITVKKGDTPDPEDGVKNHGDLDKITDPKHPGTKTTYTWKKTPDTSVAGDVPATVIVHYPDGSDKSVDITVHVVDDTPVVPTKNPDPTGQDIHTPQGKVPTPESAITNKDKMPDGTKYTWKEIPDVNTLGKHPSVVVVTYPDGTAVEVKVNVFVDGTPEVKKETKAPVVKKQVVEPTKVETRQKLVNNYVAPRAVEVQRAQAKGKRQLPQTGAKENIASEVLGMLSVGLGALTAGFASKRRKKNR